MVNWIRPDSSEDNTYGIDLTKMEKGWVFLKTRKMACSKSTDGNVSRKGGGIYSFLSLGYDLCDWGT